MDSPSPPSKSWSIHTRREITSKYEILERVGSGAYSDVYKARRLSDSVTVALKEVHDYQSAYREIDALQTLKDSPNVVELHEYFYSDHDDAVLVLEYLPTDLAAVIRAGKKEWEGGIGVGELKRWMVQILRGIDACHRNFVVHRDLKPANLLVSAEGVLKIADFGQARILLAPDDDEHIHSPNQPNSIQENVPIPDSQSTQTSEEHVVESNDIDKDRTTHNGPVSCIATCTTSDREDSFQHPYSYEGDEGGNDENTPLTSCVGTRWYRAPELLYGSMSYGLEIDLWSIGCIFAKLLTLGPIFKGNSDIDQIGKIFSVLGNLTKEVFPDCESLPDYKIISFQKVDEPIGLEACLANRSADEVNLVKKILCFDPKKRATAVELLHDKYLNEEPLPMPLSELRVPSKSGDSDEDSPREWNDYNKGLDSDSDFDEFGSTDFTTTENGFSIRFP